MGVYPVSTPESRHVPSVLQPGTASKPVCFVVPGSSKLKFSTQIGAAQAVPPDNPSSKTKSSDTLVVYMSYPSFYIGLRSILEKQRCRNIRLGAHV